MKLMPVQPVLDSDILYSNTGSIFKVFRAGNRVTFHGAVLQNSFLLAFHQLSNKGSFRGGSKDHIFDCMKWILFANAAKLLPEN
jgi:hypothetical protein